MPSSQSFSLNDLTPAMLAHFQQNLQQLQAWLAAPQPASLRIGRKPEIVLPDALVALLLQAFEQAAAGKKVMLVDTDEEVSPEKAAVLLQVSRPFLVKQLDAGLLPFHWVGTHRRLRLADVLAYRQQRQEQSRATLRQMREEAEELGPQRSLARLRR